jgi:2-isopropylmalate synthase
MKLSRLVTSVTGQQVQNNKAIVGANAFAHESGIHQDGMLKHAGTYEIMTPESVGWTKSNLVMGKHSGRHAFKEKITSLGFEIGDNALEDAFNRFKDLADKKKEIFDEDIIALLDARVVSKDDPIQFVSLKVNCGTGQKNTAELSVKVDGQTRTITADGVGSVDAIFKAIKSLIPHDARLKLYQVHGITQGTDAQAEVTVRLATDTQIINGHAADPDTLVASAMAYLDALCRLRLKVGKLDIYKDVAGA